MNDLNLNIRPLLVLFPLLLGTSVQAGYITTDTSSYANVNYDADYLIRDFGTNAPPQSPLSGVPFVLPSSGNNAYFFSGDNSQTPQALTLNVSVTNAMTVYLLLNTNWGPPGFKTGKVEFKTASQNYAIDLVNGVNIRDWNQLSWANSTSDPANTNNVYRVDRDWWGVEGRIDMLAVDLPGTFIGDQLTSIVISDFGWDGYSHIRLAGVTFDDYQKNGGGVPEPSILALWLAGLTAFGVARRKRRG